MTCNMYDMQHVSAESTKKYQEQYMDKTYYSTTEALSDNIYYSYLEDENKEDYKKLVQFKNCLEHAKHFQYITEATQPLELYGHTFDKQFLYGYETGNSEENEDIDNLKKSYRVKAIQTSDDFYTEYNIKLADGRLLQADDYKYQSGKPIPVILGNSYQQYFHIGDKLSGMYLTEDEEFVIVGFLQPKQFYYASGERTMVSLSRYILMPAFEADEIMPDAKINLLQQMYGVAVSSDGYDACVSEYDQAKKDCGLETWDMVIKDPDLSNSNIFKIYGAMSEEVSQQFKIIYNLFLILAIISITFVLCAILKDNEEEFGIELFCGAKDRDIWMQIMILIGLIEGPGLFIAILFLGIAQIQVQSFCFIIIVSLLLDVGIGIVGTEYVKHRNLTELLGGKE